MGIEEARTANHRASPAPCMNDSDISDMDMTFHDEHNQHCMYNKYQIPIHVLTHGRDTYRHE